VRSGTRHGAASGTGSFLVFRVCWSTFYWFFLFTLFSDRFFSPLGHFFFAGACLFLISIVGQPLDCPTILFPLLSPPRTLFPTILARCETGLFGFFLFNPFCAAKGLAFFPPSVGALYPKKRNDRNLSSFPPMFGVFGGNNVLLPNLFFSLYLRTSLLPAWRGHVVGPVLNHL